MEILKIKLNEKQPIAQQLYLTEESDYGLAIQIDDLQSQGPETITFNGSQITSEKDKVADYNLFKLKTPKYDKTQNKYLIEIPDTDGSVTYKITVNIIQSETVYQDNGDNSSVELPEWTENIDGDANNLNINKDNVNLYADVFCVTTTGAGITAGQQYTHLSTGGGNSVKVSIDDGITINKSGTERFTINNTTSEIYSPNKKSTIRLANTEANIFVNDKYVLSVDNTQTSLLYDNGNTGVFLGQNSLSIDFCGATGMEMAQGFTCITNGYSRIRLEQNKVNILAPLEARIESDNDISLSSSRGSISINACGRVGEGIKANVDSFCIFDGNNDLILSGGHGTNTYIFGGPNGNKSAINIDSSINLCGKQDVTINSNNYISLRSKNTQLSSDNIEICGTQLKIYNSNITVENGCTSVTNAQLSYLFQIAKKLTPENLPSVLETLGLNT